MDHSLLVLTVDKFALENDLTPVGTNCLPDRFFTNYLRQNQCKFEGAEDLENVRKTAASRLKEIMIGMENGSIRFMREMPTLFASL